MQQQVSPSPATTTEFTTTEILQMLRALDALIEDVKTKDDSPLKETSAYSDAMMMTFILCSGLSLLYLGFVGLKSLVDLMVYFIANVFWNGVDATALADSVKDFFAHQDAESRRAAIAGMGSVGVMTGATLWSLIEVGLSGWKLPTAASIAVGGAVVGVGFVAGTFSFSLAAFASAYQSRVAMQQAEKRSTYDGLLEYKQAQLAEKEAEQKKLNTKIQTLEAQQTSTSARTPTIEEHPLLNSSALPTRTSNKIEQLQKKRHRQ